jgi:hypothetical protein
LSAASLSLQPSQLYQLHATSFLFGRPTSSLSSLHCTESSIAQTQFQVQSGHRETTLTQPSSSTRLPTCDNIPQGSHSFILTSHNHSGSQDVWKTRSISGYHHRWPEEGKARAASPSGKAWPTRRQGYFGASRWCQEVHSTSQDHSQGRSYWPFSTTA